MTTAKAKPASKPEPQCLHCGKRIVEGHLYPWVHAGGYRFCDPFQPHKSEVAEPKP